MGMTIAVKLQRVRDMATDTGRAWPCLSENDRRALAAFVAQYDVLRARLVCHGPLELGAGEHYCAICERGIPRTPR